MSNQKIRLSVTDFNILYFQSVLTLNSYNTMISVSIKISTVSQEQKVPIQLILIAGQALAGLDNRLTGQKVVSSLSKLKRSLYIFSNKITVLRI